MKLHQGYKGHNNTPLEIVYSQLNEMGHGDDCDKIAVASQLLGKEVKNMGDLTDGECSRLSIELVKVTNYGTEAN
jgi:hypothetical protein